jgi:transposase
MVAMKATARKLAVIFYNVLTKGIEFVEQGLIRYQQQYEAQLRQRLQKQAQRLGLTLVPVAPVH